MKYNKFVEFRDSMNKKILSKGTINTKRFFTLDNSVYNNGALSKKQKELMGLTASLVLRCEGCVNYHIDQCVSLGISDEELFEAFDIALIIGGSIVIPHLREAVYFLEELRKNGDKNE